MIVEPTLSPLNVSTAEEKASSLESMDEKVDSIDIARGDEALKLISVERRAQFTEEYNRKLRRKLDLLIPPLCAAVYFTQYLDKTSLNYASIMGLPIVGQRYNLISLAFFLGALVWEFPTVYISQKLRVAKYLGVNIVVWGAVLMLHAASGSSFPAFFVLRFILGMCESCVAPILILIISMFYKKNEQVHSSHSLYAVNGLTQIFGGFAAYGCSFDDGRVLAPYKIIYVLLGGLAILVGISVLIWMPDSPVHAQFLTKEERIAALERVRDDQGGVENKTLKMYQVWEALTDIRAWLIVLTALLTGIPGGGLSNFSNLIIKSFGYTSKQTLILSTPGGAVASITTLLCGRYADKKNERMLPIIFALVPTIIGSGDSSSGVYLIGTLGGSISTVYAYNASNTSGHTKKSTMNAMTLASYSVGNIIGTEIFQPKDAPDYIPGKVAIMVLLTVQLFVCLILRWINLSLNKRKQEKIQELRLQHQWSDLDVQKERERHAFIDLTDKENLYFVYTA
ncbi:MFS general substrate transporter [Crucibulum laeve]|uniref:MFS general substrate transporter n=1 Tax=Crucibulum laeve TaxID=68775 RepID=A0A5C3LK24_9AGAR|nr:MFS general substrate transporter [Crucibulum laeve]